jgi:ankyrin repeat protein
MRDAISERNFGPEHLEVVEMLLAANADVNATASFDQTALQAAAREGHLEVVEKLEKSGAEDGL